MSNEGLLVAALGGMACSPEGVYTFDASKETEVLASIAKAGRQASSSQGHVGAVAEEDWVVESASEAEAATIQAVLDASTSSASGFPWQR